jgi:uncharacterized membrane protein required for colicin V production
MNAIAAAELPTTLNWYDYVVGFAILTGFFTGLRAGLIRSLVRVGTWILMTLFSLLLYVTVGLGLKDYAGLDTDSANLQAFLMVSLLVFILCHFAGDEIVFRGTKRPLPAWLDNLGGVLFGPLVMVVFVAWLSIVLVLMRNPFCHQLVARNSYCASRLVQKFPSVADTAGKKTDEPWFMKPIPRREEPTAEGYKKRP